MTKQWIGIEEAADKYQISAEHIREWSKGKEITFTEVGNYLLLDEENLIECIHRNIQFSLAKEELDAQKAELLKVKEEKLFVLELLKELTPPIRVILIMLADTIVEEDKRDFFLSIARWGGMRRYASLHGKKYKEIKKEFSEIVGKMQRNTEFVESLWKELFRLKAEVRRYEKGLEQSEGKDSVEKEKDSPVSKMEIPVRELFLLHASVMNLGFPLFAQRIIMKEGIENIKDLLRFIRENGMKGFRRFRQLGPTTVAKMEARLRELNLLDEKGDSYLYAYLDKGILETEMGR